jgi:flagellar hook-length control protein FliK
MLESNNILLDLGKAPKSALTGPAEPSQDIAAEKPGPFSALLGDAAARIKAAKSGNQMPLSAQQKSASIQFQSPEQMSTRTLQGGTALIVGGAEPTDAGLLAFARAQGMDPEALGLVSQKGPDQPDSTVAEAALTDSSVLFKSASITGANVTGASVTREGGTALIVGGAEPTDAGLLAFARAQGMDPEALGLVSQKGPDQPDSTVAEVALTDSSVLFKSASITGANVTGASVTRVSNLETSLSDASDIGPRISGARVTDTDFRNTLGNGRGNGEDNTLRSNTEAPAVPSPELAAMAGLNGAATQNSALSTNPGLQKTGLQHNALNTQSHMEQHGPVNAQQNPSDIISGGVPKTDLNPIQAASFNLQQAPTKLAQGLQPSTDTVKKTLDIKAETTISSVKLDSSVASLDGASAATEANRLTIAPKLAKVFLTQHRDRQNLPPTKMDAINLVEAKALIASSQSVISSAPALSAGMTSSPLFAESATTNLPAASNLRPDLLAPMPAEDARQEMLRRQDDYMQLSRQLTDVLGKRLTAQIQRGSWQVEMELHPKSLGRVDVQLEMKNGELEARFIASNATTRDLINEGMPRLREAFQEHGTETAYKDSGAANQDAADGKSTASDNTADGSDNRLASESESDSGKNSQQSTADGLNILV